MSTRHKVDLRDKSISDLQLPFQQKKTTPVKEESSPSISSNSSIQVIHSSPPMSTDDDIRELDASRLIQLKIEEKFLSKILPFKSSDVSDQGSAWDGTIPSRPIPSHPIPSHGTFFNKITSHGMG